MSACSSPYGAFELKATYQRNLLLAMMTTISLLAVTLLSAHLAIRRHPLASPPRSQVDTVRIKVHISPVTSIIKPPSEVRPRTPEATAGRYAIPEPVPDDPGSDNDAVIMSTVERADAVDLGSGIGSGEGGSFVIEDSSETFPGIDSFVFVEEQPELVYSVQPEYPHLAQIAGQEGLVVIKALISKTGDVIEAVVLVSSGFPLLDEAARAVAGKYKYRPAIQNGRPVALWVTYKVDFRLDR